MTAILNLGYVLARRRLMSSFRIELTVLLGVTLAVVLLSSAVVFNDLLAETALRRALADAEPSNVNIWVRVFNDLDDPRTATPSSDRYLTSHQFVAHRVLPPLGDAVGALSFQVETATFYFTGRPNLDLPNDVRPRGRMQYLSGLREGKGTLVQGRWPELPADGGYDDSTGNTDDVVIEVAVDSTGFEFLDIPLGEGFGIVPATGGDGQATTQVVLVGVVEPTDPDEEYWYRRQKLLSYHDDDWTLVPMFVAEDALRQQVGRRYPGIYTSSAWFLQTDREGIPAKKVDELQQSLRQVRRNVANHLPNGSTSTGLARILEDHEEQLLLARIPLFLMVFLVTGILAYYLTITAGMVIRARGSEIAMLKSRGATTVQIGILTLVEGLLLAGPALVAGALLSPLLARGLGGLVFDAESAGAPVSLSWQAFGMGAAGAVLAVVVLSLATLAAASKGIVEFRQAGARPARTPFVHRYYLDLLALAVIAFLWWQISNRGTVLTRSLGGRELEVDFALLLGPALGLVALGLLVMRVFPLAMGLSARVVGPVGPGWLVQGLRRIARDPIAPGSLVALLMLATALGVVGSAFSATLTKSTDDRVRYDVGADIRIQHDGGRIARAFTGASEMLPGGAEAMRTEGSLLTEGFGSQRVSVLAVESDRLADVAWWREDFGDGNTLPELMALIAPNPNAPEGLPLPENITGLSLWARTGGLQDRLVAVAARLRDGAGRHYDVRMGDVSGHQWERLDGDIALRLGRTGRRTEDEDRPRLDVPPYTLINLQIVGRTSADRPGVLFMDGLTAQTPQGDVVISDLASAAGWSVIEDYVRPGLYSLETSRNVARPGAQGSVVFSWAPGGIGVPGLRPGENSPPLPAVVSPEILDATGAEVGDEISLGMSTFALPLVITGVAEFFPTVDPRSQPFVIADLGEFVDYANRHSRRIFGGASEVWLDREILPGDLETALAAADDATGQISQLGVNSGEVMVAEEEAALRGKEPLANAGWGGLLVIMFLALALASATGIALYCWLDTRERQTEFALLRTLGSSRGQLNAVVWFNLAVVVVAGVAVGTWAGAQIGAALLPVLEVAEGGVRATPPLTFETDWRMLALAYAVLAVVSVVTVIWLAFVTNRLEVQRVLRAGEGG
ncbi:MAG: ABC transporter permease [Dehalococcoidia bacterium]|nr:ABC transporter permease [Dehalococcoidia bacterium]